MSFRITVDTSYEALGIKGYQRLDRRITGKEAAQWKQKMHGLGITVTQLQRKEAEDEIVAINLDSYKYDDDSRIIAETLDKIYSRTKQRVQPLF